MVIRFGERETRPSAKGSVRQPGSIAENRGEKRRTLCRNYQSLFTLRSLGRREEAGKLAASLLEHPYEIRSREGNRPAAFAQTAEALELSFPVCLLEEEAVATLAEKARMLESSVFTAGE